LKVLGKSHLESGERQAWLERFRREARITSQLTSPHTVRIYDYGVNQLGVAYSVMELLDGEELDAYVKRTGPMAPAEVIAVALQICDSLGEAHERGIVHRDVKPANVFLVRSGDRVQAKVLDFGLADFTEQLRKPQDTTGRFTGTPAFMPPEAFLGRPIDARSDIYELGCLLYFLLSGRNVFERSTLTGVALAHIREAPVDVDKVSSHPAPAALRVIISRCLEKSPDDRYQSVEELEEDLLWVQDTESGLGTRPSEVAGGATGSNFNPGEPPPDVPRDSP
jgi:serine/threonine-protein kinase